MKSNVLQLTDRVEDTRFETVRSTMDRIMKCVTGEDPYWEEIGFHPTNCVLVFVDETDGKFSLRSIPSYSKLNEIVALLELAKHAEIHRMRGDPDPSNA